MRKKLTFESLKKKVNIRTIREIFNSIKIEYEVEDFKIKKLKIDEYIYKDDELAIGWDYDYNENDEITKEYYIYFTVISFDKKSVNNYNFRFNENLNEILFADEDNELLRKEIKNLDVGFFIKYCLIFIITDIKYMIYRDKFEDGEHYKNQLRLNNLNILIKNI